jgi:hypothetical protein
MPPPRRRKWTAQEKAALLADVIRSFDMPKQVVNLRTLIPDSLALLWLDPAIRAAPTGALNPLPVRSDALAGCVQERPVLAQRALSAEDRLLALTARS